MENDELKLWLGAHEKKVFLMNDEIGIKNTEIANLTCQMLRKPRKLGRHLPTNNYGSSSTTQKESKRNKRKKGSAQDSSDEKGEK